MMKICVASKKKHAEMWRSLRDQGLNIISTWIDNIGRTKEQFIQLSVDCLNESSVADVTIIYCEKGENHKGIFFEAGVALHAGKKVYLVGDHESMRHIFRFHPNWKNCESVKDAVILAGLDIVLTGE